MGLTGDDRSVTDDNFIHDITRWAQRLVAGRVTTNLNGSQHSDLIRSGEHLTRGDGTIMSISAQCIQIFPAYRMLLFVSALHICIAGRGGKSSPDVLDVLARAIFGPSLPPAWSGLE